MKKNFLLSCILLLSSATAFAQVGLDSTATIAPAAPPVPAVPAAPATPAYTPPPPPPPATTTTVITTNAAPAPAAPVYVPGDRTLDVNRIRFGAFVAPNLSWMKPTAATDDENKFNVQGNGSKLGFTYGLMAEYFFAQNYGIVTGIQINQTGGKILATAKDQALSSAKVLKADFEYRLQYLEIPVALKLRTDEISGFRFFGQLGASLGINIGKKADYTVTYVPTGGTASRDTSGEKIKLTGSIGLIAPILFQMNIGAGLEYPITSKLHFYVGIFFNNGFAPDATKPNLFDSAKLGYAGEFRDANTRLNNLALRIGLFF